jgi:hypothetical protein
MDSGAMTQHLASCIIDTHTQTHWWFVTVLQSVNTTTNEITVTTAPLTGTEVLFYSISATPPTPLIDGEKYYVIKVDATHVKLATTKANATAGTAIDITAQSNGATALVFFPNYDFGQYLVNSRAVAILPIEREITSPQYGNDVIWGGSVYTTNDGSRDVLATTTNAVENRGYFVTPKMYASGVSDVFNLLTLKYSKFLSENDKIVIKYRTEDDRVEFKQIRKNDRWIATWTSTSTFTTTEPEFANAIEGDEVEFMTGGGAGILAHITDITENAGTYTVTIDETYDWYTAGDKARFMFRNWKKFYVIAHGDKNAVNGYFSEQMGVTGKFIQFKVELRGVRTQIEEMALDNKNLLPFLK